MENASVVLYAWGPHHSTFDTRVAFLDASALDMSFSPERVRHVGMRQGHMVLAVLLTPEELVEVSQRFHIHRVGEILGHSDLDWSTVGMIMTAILAHQVESIPGVTKRRRR